MWLRASANKICCKPPAISVRVHSPPLGRPPLPRTSHMTQILGSKDSWAICDSRKKTQIPDYLAFCRRHLEAVKRPSVSMLLPIMDCAASKCARLVLCFSWVSHDRPPHPCTPLHRGTFLRCRVLCAQASPSSKEQGARSGEGDGEGGLPDPSRSSKVCRVCCTVSAC